MYVGQPEFYLNCSATYDDNDDDEDDKVLKSLVAAAV